MKNNEQPFISIITATWNAADALPRLLRSYSAQTYERTELIVVDGASTDGTLDILRGSDSPVDILISEPDEGIYAAWNKGIEAASGSWITFLGADDFLLRRTSLAEAADALTAVEGTRLVYGAAVLFDETGHPIGEVRSDWNRERRSFLQGVMRVPHPGLLHHRKLFAERGLFDQRYTIAGDYELLLREVPNVPPRYLPNLQIVGITVTGVSRGFDRRFDILEEVRLARRANGIEGLPWAWYRMYAVSLIRKVLLHVVGQRGTDWITDLVRRARRRNRVRPLEPGSFVDWLGTRDIEP